MLEIIVFAVVFVAAQVLAGFVIMNIVMSEKFIKYYTKMMFKVMSDLEKEFENLN